MDFQKAVINQRKIRKPFTEKEDRIIENYVHKYGVKNFEKLEMELENRSTRQIRERYRLYLDPKVNHSPFTAHEGEILLKAFDQFQGRWSSMVKLFSGRTDVSLKYRHRKLMRKSNHQKRSLKTKYPENGGTYILFNSFFGDELNHTFKKLLKDSQGALVENLFDEDNNNMIQ
jgi:hypothetical protein